MSDSFVYQSDDFTVEELLQAARGESTALSPQLAVTLLHAKLGDDAEQPLTELASDERADARGRHAAVLALASHPSAHQVLESLTASRSELVAEAAAQALR
ncbi:hypothetical protein [Streptomyces sp. NPDC001880]